MQVNKEAIKWMLDQQHISSEVRQGSFNDFPILEGNLSFETLPSGIDVHCCDSIEKQNASSSAELSPCMSINILLDGKLSFSLGEQQYNFNNQGKPATLFVNVIGETEVFTRRIVEDQRVKKVNICVDKEWLIKRSQSAQERKNIEAIFSQRSKVHILSLPAELPKLAEDLMHFRLNPKFESQIQVEHISLKIIATCITMMLKDNSLLVAAETTPQTSTNNHAFFQLFDGIALQGFSLNEIANKLGVSVSTLQRKVKERYQVTAIEYIRYKKLNKAKASLIIDDLSIGEIAFIAGYSHVSNFITAFKKRFNITPAQFRDVHIN